MLSTLLPAAEATGRCEIRAGCTVRRIVVGADDKVEGVEYVDSRGKVGVLHARVVCLAASAVESARLLLLSETARFPHGLANGSGLVGKNLTFSALGKAVAFFDRHELISRWAPPDGSAFLQRTLQDHYWMDRASGLACPKGGTYAFSLQAAGAGQPARSSSARMRASSSGQAAQGPLTSTSTTSCRSRWRSSASSSPGRAPSSISIPRRRTPRTFPSRAST